MTLLLYNFTTIQYYAQSGVMSNLEDNATKPKVRIELFKDCVSNFKQDINRELGDLKHR